MRLRGLRENGNRRVKALEYALVILTVALVVALAAWFISNEIIDGFANSS